MTQENKNLLLKDLSSRLPYRVIVDYSYNAFDIRNGNHVRHGSKCILTCDLLDVFISPRQNEKGEYIKPYLFPLSSMTEEQKIECFKETDIELDEYGEIWSRFPISDTDTPVTNIHDWLKVINWCYKNHFDINGLIPSGSAIDATELNIYSKENRR